MAAQACWHCNYVTVTLCIVGPYFMNARLRALHVRVCERSHNCNGLAE